MPGDNVCQSLAFRADQGCSERCVRSAWLSEFEIRLEPPLVLPEVMQQPRHFRFRIQPQGLRENLWPNPPLRGGGL
jgi:hypothetical protein